MKTLRNCVIILVALVIFVFFFAGKGIFDGFLPLTQLRGTVMLAVHSTDLVDDGKYGMMVRGGEEELVEQKMQRDGYALQEKGERLWLFTRKGEAYALTVEDFLGCKVFRASE